MISLSLLISAKLFLTGSFFRISSDLKEGSAKSIRLKIESSPGYRRGYGIFFEDFKEFKDINSSDETNDDLNYSFLSRTFSSLSKTQKDKIIQILNNTSKFEKVG